MAHTIASYVSFKEITTEEMYLSVWIPNSLLLLACAWSIHPVGRGTPQNNSAGSRMKRIFSSFKVIFTGAGEVTRQLRIQASLPENLVWFPAPTWGPTVLSYSRYRRSKDLFLLCQYQAHTCIHTNMQAKHSYT